MKPLNLLAHFKKNARLHFCTFQMVKCRGNKETLPPKLVLAVIQQWKDRGLNPESLTSGKDLSQLAGQGVALYRNYQARLKALGAMDFGDLLLHCLTLFRQHPETLEDYGRRFKYILVDEYQDTNVAQYLWLRLLAGTHKNLCCVGDDDQSIYSWRGAEVGNILRFERTSWHLSNNSLDISLGYL